MSKKNYNWTRFFTVATLFSIPVVGLSVALSLYTNKKQIEINTSDRPSVINSEEFDKLLGVNEISDYQIVNKTKEEFDKFLISSKLDRKKAEIHNSKDISPRQLIEQISDFTSYINLSTVLKISRTVTIDMSSLAFYDWEYDDRQTIKRSEIELEKLSTNKKGEFERKLITFKVIDKSSNITKNANIAFSLSPLENEIKDQIDKAKEEIISEIQGNTENNDLEYSKDDDLFTKKIKKEFYDETMLLVNSGKTRELLYDLFKLDENNSLPSDLIFEQKICDSDSKEIKEIDLNFGWYEKGIIVNLSLMNKHENGAKNLIYKQEWNVKLMLDTEKANPLDVNIDLFNQRITNWRKQINIEKDEQNTYDNLNKKPLIVSKTALDLMMLLGIDIWKYYEYSSSNDWKIEEYKDEGKIEEFKDKLVSKGGFMNNARHLLSFTEGSLSDPKVMYLFEYIFGDFNNSEQNFHFKNRIDIYEKIDYGSQNSENGLFKSALGVKNYLYLIKNKDFREKIKMDVKLERTGKAAPDPDKVYQSTDYVLKSIFTFEGDDGNKPPRMFVQPSWRLKIKIYHEDSDLLNEEIIVHLAAPKTREYYEGGSYRFLSDLLKNAKPGTIQYDSYQNILTLNTNRNLFNNFRGILQRMTDSSLPGSQSSATIYDTNILKEMLESLNDAIGYNDNSFEIHRYGPTFRLYYGVSYERFKEELKGDKEQYKIQLDAITSSKDERDDPMYDGLYVNLNWNILK